MGKNQDPGWTSRIRNTVKEKKKPCSCVQEGGATVHYLELVMRSDNASGAAAIVKRPQVRSYLVSSLSTESYFFRQNFPLWDFFVNSNVSATSCCTCVVDPDSGSVFILTKWKANLFRQNFNVLFKTVLGICTNGSRFDSRYDPFFSDFQDAKKKICHFFSSYNYPQTCCLQSLINCFQDFCKHYFSPLNTFMRKGKDPGPDPYPWLTDPDSDPPTLVLNIEKYDNYDALDWHCCV